MKETSVKIKSWPESNADWENRAIALLKYQYLKSDEFFQIYLGFNCTDGSLRFASRQWYFELTNWSDGSCWDWMEWHLVGVGLVSFTYHMTGDQTLRIFELRYVAPDKAKTSSISGPLEPFRLGFMVPSMIREKVESNYFGETHEAKEFQLADVFPPDIFGKEHTDQTYVDMSALEERKQFYVLTYTAPPNTNPQDTTPICAYVVIGFHESTAWMDIVVSTDSPEEVWKSYCDSGWRAPTRIQCSLDAMLDPLALHPTWSFRGPKFAGNVKEWSSLQLGSHVLSVNYFIA
ncbi:hypothetical protein D9758_013439 [Tetrapyrgos nigripes]|uniref:Uncharacterized protein n=1 Tax=Tetrapyrgos nigripes TaxID=182062 RepID=A0A8H5CKN7_9AGAR|nr:hypothetical protein D9758_013439 [Tetrapyrgos nigripes]